MIVNNNAGNSKVNFGAVHLKKSESFSKHIQSFGEQAKVQANKVIEKFEAKLLDRPETDILVLQKMPEHEAKTVKVLKKNPHYAENDARRMNPSHFVEDANEDVKFDLKGKTVGFKLNLDEGDDNIVNNLMKTYKYLAGK